MKMHPQLLSPSLGLLFSVLAGAHAAGETAPAGVQATIDSLSTVRDSLRIRVIALTQRIDSLRIVLDSADISQMADSGLVIRLRGDTRLYSYPTALGPTAAFMGGGTKIRTYGCTNNMLAVKFKGKNGFVSAFIVEESPELEQMLRHCKKDTAIIDKLAMESNAKISKARRPRGPSREQLVKLYGEANGDLIAEHRIWIGMTAAMARVSWGEPQDINKTVTAALVYEQWVYGRTYLYFENGILTSWQEW